MTSKHEQAVKAELTRQANQVRCQIAHDNDGRRELATKARKRKGETSVKVGQIDKSYSTAIVVLVSTWRGVTTVELTEYERLVLDLRPSGHCLFLDIKHLDELIAILSKARQAASTLLANQ